MVFSPVPAMRTVSTLPREFTQSFTPRLSKSQRRDIDCIPGFTDSRLKQQQKHFVVSKGGKLQGFELYRRRVTLFFQRPETLWSGYNEYERDMPSGPATDQSPPNLQGHFRAAGATLVSSRQHRLAVVQVLVQAFLRSRMYASGSNNCQAPPSHSGCRRVNSNTVSGRAEFKRPRTEGTEGRDFGGGGGGGGGGNGGDDQHDRHGSDRVQISGGRFRCPVYGKANNKTKNNCSLETFETEAEVLQHALQRHEWCPICKKEKIDTRTDFRSMDLEKLFFDNMKNLRFHVLRHHLRVIRCPHAGCGKTFGLLNAFSRDGHAKTHYPAQADKDSLKERLEGDFASAERTLQRENPALFRLFDGVRRCKSRVELEQFLYQDGVKVFDNDGDVDNISPPNLGGTSPAFEHHPHGQQLLSQILPGTPQTSASEYPDTPVAGFHEITGYQSISNDVSHAGGRFSPFSNTNAPSFLLSDQNLAPLPLFSPIGTSSPETFPSHGGNTAMNRMLAPGSSGYLVNPAARADTFSHMYDHARHLSSLWDKANLSEQQALFKTMAYFFLGIHEFVEQNLVVVENQSASYLGQRKSAEAGSDSYVDDGDADRASWTATADSAFGDSIAHSYGDSPGPRLRHSFQGH